MTAAFLSSLNRAGVRRCVRRLGDHLGSCTRFLHTLRALHSPGFGGNVPGHNLGEQHGFYRHHQVFQWYGLCSVGLNVWHCSGAGSASGCRHSRLEHAGKCCTEQRMAVLRWGLERDVKESSCL